MKKPVSGPPPCARTHTHTPPHRVHKDHGLLSPPPISGEAGEASSRSSVCHTAQSGQTYYQGHRHNLICPPPDCVCLGLHFVLSRALILCGCQKTFFSDLVLKQCWREEMRCVCVCVSSRETLNQSGLVLFDQICHWDRD